MQSFALAISGPVRKVAHCEFQYIPYDCGMDNPKRSHNAWIAAVKPATATHKRVVQPIRVLLPYPPKKVVDGLRSFLLSNVYLGRKLNF